MGRIGVAALGWARTHPSPDGSDLKLLTAVLGSPRVPAAVLSQAADTARSRLTRAEDTTPPANPAQLARLRKVLGQRAHAVALPTTTASLDEAEADIAAPTSHAQVRAALRNNKLDSAHADRAVRLAARWVEHRHDHPDFRRSGQRRLLAKMLGAAIGNTRATPEAVAPLLPTALSWLADQEPGAAELARSVLGSPNAGAARAEAADWLLRRAEAAPAAVSPHLLRTLLSQPALPDAVRQRTEDLTLAWLPAHCDHAAWPAVTKALLVTVRGDATRNDSDVLARSVLDWAEGHHESPHTGPLLDILVRHCQMGADLYGTAAGAALTWVLRNRHEKHAPRILAALVSNAQAPPSVRTLALETALAHLRSAPRHHNDHIRLLRALIGATDADGATVDEAAELALRLLPGAGPVWTPQLLRSLVSSPMSGPDVISRATGAAEDWLAGHPGDPAAASVLDALVTSPRTDPERVRNLRENAAERPDRGAPGLV
ncbi:hypothetical protein [Streptomyces sp. DSM 41013]